MDKENPLSFSADIRECWSVHQVLRSLGFSADDIYINVGRDINHPEVAALLFVVLRAQGKDFNVRVGAYFSEEEADAAVKKWSEFVNLANAGAFEQSDLDNIYESSHVMKNQLEFVVSLHEKGIKPMLEWS